MGGCWPKKKVEDWRCVFKNRRWDSLEAGPLNNPLDWWWMGKKVRNIKGLQKLCFENEMGVTPGFSLFPFIIHISGWHACIYVNMHVLTTQFRTGKIVIMHRCMKMVYQCQNQV